ncbi:MAG: DUF1040 family protein [Deltaproteobacteria bacterium]|nr:DUF1040 family protein [Deltaproteobacteria bacterium]
MRDEKRITEILGLIQKIWEKKNDMRFFQLIYVLQSKYSKEKGNIGQIKFKENDGYSQIGFDMFGTEDEELIKFLKEFS